MKIVSYFIIIITGRLWHVYARWMFVCVCLKSQRESERIEQKTSTTTTTRNEVGSKLDDFSHAKISRHRTCSAASVEKDGDDEEEEEEEATNASSRQCSVDFHSLLSALTRSLTLLKLPVELYLNFFSRDQFNLHRIE